jgi:hypothetical protein
MRRFLAVLTLSLAATSSAAYAQAPKLTLHEAKRAIHVYNAPEVVHHCRRHARNVIVCDVEYSGPDDCPFTVEDGSPATDCKIFDTMRVVRRNRGTWVYSDLTGSERVF